MKIHGKTAADALLSFSPIILLLSLCVYLLTTPVNRRTDPVKYENIIKEKTEKRQASGKAAACLAEMHFPCFIL